VCAGHSDVTALIGEYIPANGRVHGAVRTITQAMRSYVKTKSENKNKIENKRIEVDARCMEDHP
jgi:ribosome-associated translation inhibitor RaiA